MKKMFIFICFIIYIVYAYITYDNNNTISNNKTYSTDTDTNNYCVYKHTCPNDKVYIGITKQNPPSKRWNNGRGYEKNRYFYNDILRYGWKNISHEILYNNLSEYEARQIEHILIRRYRSNYRCYGYNIRK